MSSDELMATEGLHFSAWHPLLVRTLKIVLEDAKLHAGCRLGTLLAVLARIPIPPESVPYLDGVLPLLRDFIDKISLTDALQGSPYNACSFPDDLYYLTGTAKTICVRKPGSRKASTRTAKRRSTGTTQPESESEKELYHKLKSVGFFGNILKIIQLQINERVLLSDSDGFAFWKSEDPSIEEETVRNFIRDNSLYTIYKSIFGVFPTLFSPLGLLVNAIIVHTKFVSRCSIPSGLDFLCDFFDRCSHIVLNEDSKDMFRQWTNWQTILKQGCRCISFLVRYSTTTLGCRSQTTLVRVITMLMSLFGRNICATVRLNSFVNGEENCDEINFVSFDDSLRLTHDVSLNLFDDILSLLVLSQDSSFMTRLGDYIVSWTEDPLFIQIVPNVLKKVEKELGLSKANVNSSFMRFAFELFASLVDVPGITEDMFAWALSLPAGFKKMVTGAELLAAVSGQAANFPEKCSTIFKKHLPVMYWSSPERSTSFSGILSSDTLPSEAIIRFTQDVLCSAKHEIIVMLCTYLLPYCDPFDAEYLIINAIVPDIEDNCSELSKQNDPISAEEMSPCIKDILKSMELVAAHLRTTEASSEVIRKIVRPYREFYFSASELQDVFVAVCAKSVRYSPSVAQESGICEWMVDRLSSLRVASADIWLFVEDSASKFSKLIISILNLICDVIEEGTTIFNQQAEKLRNNTNKLVDICFEWLGNPTTNYRSIVRISEMISKALSIYLILSDNDVIDHFSSALLRSLGDNPQEMLVSVLLCSLLDRCISRLPPPLGSLLSIENDSEDDQLMGEGGPMASSPTRRVLHPQLVPAVLVIFTTILKKRETAGSELEFLVCKISKRLQQIDRHFQDGQKWMPQLFALCTELVRLRASEQPLNSLLRLMSFFIKRDPKSKHIHQIMTYYNECEQYKEVILEALYSLLNENFPEPASCLVFPQPLVRQDDKAEITTRTQMEAVFRREFSEEQEKSERLEAVGKYLANRSDEEMETERRKEKKKHLRDHLRGQSMVKLDSANKSDLASAKVDSFARDSAASILLNDPNYVSSYDGLTLSFWMKRKEPARMLTKLAPLHVASIGGEELTATCWLNSKGRLVVEVYTKEIILAKVWVKGQITDHSWTHVTYGVRLSSEFLSIQATVGNDLTTREIDLVVKINVPTFPLTISFGSIQKRQSGEYRISTIFSFKGILPMACILTLSALGCRLSSLSETKMDSVVANLSVITTAKMVATKQHTVEIVRQDPVKFIQKVQRAVVFVVRSNQALNYGISVLPQGMEPSAIVGQPPLRMACLKFFSINWRAGRIQEFNNSPIDSFAQLGGMRFLMYLYVKAVNDGLPAGVQLRALKLLLTGTKIGALPAMEAKQLRLDILLPRILASSSAVVNDDVVDILIEFCIEFSEPPSNSNDPFTSVEDSNETTKEFDPYNSVICEPDLLVSLCCRYEIWQKERFPCWRRIVQHISNVLDPEICAIPHRFNRSQLVGVEMLPKFLHCIQEMIGNISLFPDFNGDETFVSDARAIVQCLLGCPETPQTVTQLWHFVFLSHPANDAYIEHRVQGHTSWIIPELFRDGPEGELLGDSLLSQRLRRYNELLGEEYLRNSWKDGVSPYEIRKRYEEMVGPGDEDGNTVSDLRESMYSIDSVLESPEQKEDRKQERNHPKWVVSLRAAMMDVLAAVLQNGADALLACLQHDVISFHAIVILLSHQSDYRVRDTICDMLQKFLLRCPPYTKIAFLRLQGFQILATQLRAYPPTQEIADFLFSMMCGETIRLGDGLDQTHLASMKVDRLSCESLHAILVIFENSVSDAPLFWNVTNALLKTFENNSQLQQAMLDFGLIDAMVATLRKIAYYTDTASSCYDIVLDRPSTSSQLECWSNLAQRIIITGIPYSDPALVKGCERFIWLLQLADIQAAKDARYSEDKRAQSHKIIRSQLCHLLHCWMESIRVVFSEEGRSASATSSVSSLYNQGEAESSSSSPSTELDFDYCDDAITPEKANLLDGTSPVAAFLAGSFANLRKRISNMGPISRKALRCRYNKKMGPAPLASTDNLMERIIFALDVISTICAILIPTAEVTEEEANLFHFYLYFLLTSWKREKESSRTAGQTVWNRLIVLCRDKVKIHLAQIVAFVLFPAQRKLYENTIASNSNALIYPTWKSEWVEEKRRQVVRALSHELQYRQSLASILSVNLDYEYALCLGLYDLAFLSKMKPEFETELTTMIKFLTSGKMGSSVDGFTPESLKNITTEEILSLHCFSQYRKGVMAQLRSKMEMYRDMEGKLTAEIGAVAMEVTREVAEQMNLPRKIFMRASKQAIAQVVEADSILVAIAKEICHPEAVGFEKRHWPMGWALDATEGPMRERRRLIPYQYPFEPRFFAEEKRAEVAEIVFELPLQNLLFNGEDDRPRRSFHDVAQLDEHIRLFLDATVLRGTFECQGELHVGETRLHFVGERAKSTQKGSSCDVITLSWSFSQLIEIQMRNHLLNDVALEVFLSNGETYLIVFQSNEKRGQFVKQLRESGLEHLFPNINQLVQAVVQSWRHGALSNFEYLMFLNKLAGRSFNDLMQYPVFPFILSDYTSPILDLTNPSSFRNLQKPMAIQDKRMESHYVANYNCLQAECSRDPEAGPLHFGPYHYGSHYSNSGIVVHYLVRLSPFTQIALEYQDNNFDIPDRLFNSIEATWRLSSSESTTDFKELIPEFFSISEFLVNREKLDLGIRQAGDRVGSVRLPNWTPTNNPRLFVLIHRQALESSVVTQNLHSWVDLIFGYKQMGKPALEAINVFHPATYLGRVNVDEVLDELSQSALRTMVKSYGQMPIQILQTPHQPHLYAGKDKKEREKERPPAPLHSVIGVRWGDYVGSPEQDHSQINVTLSGLKADRLGSVVALVDGTVAGCSMDTILVSASTLENPADLLCKTRVQTCLAAVSWLFSDSVLRFRLIQPEVQPWINILDYHGSKISKVSYSSTNRLLFVAFTSGLIRVFHLNFDEKGLHSIIFRSDLLAHHSSVDSLCICDEFSTAVSGDADGKVVVWDTNRLSFVRVLRKPSHPVSSICISSTSAEIVVVSQFGYGSCVELFTINGDLVGSVGTDTPVMAIAMTNQPEGCAINSLALGMQDGHIRLVEMWCLTVVRDIWHEKDQEPIISVTFASGGRKLFALLASGRVLCWQSIASISKNRAPPFSIINPHDMA